MGKIVEFIKSHPALVGVIVVGVLAIMFWPSGGGEGDSAAQSNALAASAIAASQGAATERAIAQEQANVAVALSHDEVAALGVQAAAATQMNAANNAAAVAIATMEAGVAKHTVNASLAAQKSNNTTQVTLGQQITQTEALKAIAGIIPTTAKIAADRKVTDVAGYGLMEMFKNLLNANKGVKATTSLISTTYRGNTTSVYGADGKLVGPIVSYQGLDQTGKDMDKFIVKQTKPTAMKPATTAKKKTTPKTTSYPHMG